MPGDPLSMTTWLFDGFARSVAGSMLWTGTRSLNCSSPRTGTWLLTLFLVNSSWPALWARRRVVCGAGDAAWPGEPIGGKIDCLPEAGFRVTPGEMRKWL